MNNYCSVSDSCQSQCSECIRGPKEKGRNIFILWQRSHGYKSCVSNTNTTAASSTMTFLFTVQGPRSKALLRNRYFDIILRRKSQNTSINLFTLRSAYRNGYLFRGDFGSVFLDLLERIVTALIKICLTLLKFKQKLHQIQNFHQNQFVLTNITICDMHSRSSDC